tara:strand:+ start:2160 stop:3173 length:1014 start_codon:yes stop_codon:yes gene_type:complete
MINNISPFNKLYNLRINEIKKNNLHDSLLYTNGTNFIKKGIYRWYFQNYSYDAVFTSECLIVLEDIISKFPIEIKAKDFDSSGILIDTNTYHLKITKDICYNYTNEILKGTHTIKKSNMNVYIPKLILDGNKVLSNYELKNIFQNDPDLLFERVSVVDVLKTKILNNINKNIYNTDIVLENALNNSKLTDFSVIFFDKNGLSVNYHCHSLILCLKSNFFYRLVYSSDQYKENKDRVIEIKLPLGLEINNLDVCKSIIDFFYTNKLNLKISDSINEMIEYLIDFNNIASYLEIEMLDELLNNLYSDIINIDNLNDNLNEFCKLFISHLKDTIKMPTNV